MNRPIQRLTSPIFFSTGDDGKVQEGFGGVPSTGPILFIGNHQLFAVDLNILVEELYTQHGLLARSALRPPPKSNIYCLDFCLFPLYLQSLL